jgi:type VI secretion system protein ImpA
MTSVEELLKPISAEQPCGPDLAYDPAFQQLETLLRGKPETQFSAAEDPDWKELRTLAIEFHGKAKHLTPGVILTLALMKTDGLPGLRDGLGLVRGILETFWDGVYPRLDPDDNNDPTERMNILSNLASHGDPYRFLSRLQETAICQSPSLGRVKLNDIILSKLPAGVPVEGQPTPLNESQIQAIFKDANPEGLKGVYDSVLQAQEHIRIIDAFLTEKVGTRGVNFEDLSKSLRQIQNAVSSYVGGTAQGGVEAETAGGEQGATSTTSGGAGRTSVSVPGSINSREDVVRALERICEYYRLNEPSSPVPLLLFRAQRMAKMSFMEIVNDLTPDAATTVRTVTGPQPGETTS